MCWNRGRCIWQQQKKLSAVQNMQCRLSAVALWADTDFFSNVRQISGKIEITPFDKSRITTNSYDLSLGETIIRYKTEIIDPKVETPYEEIRIPSDGMVLNLG